MNPFAMLFAAAVSEAGGAGPAGPPSNGSTYYYGGSLIGVQWTNGDSTALTQIYFYDTSGGCPGSAEDLVLLATRSAGVTSYETGQTDTCSYWLRHIKNKQVSDWYQVTGGVAECPECPL